MNYNMTDKQLRLDKEYEATLNRVMVQTGIKNPEDFTRDVKKPRLTYSQNWSRYNAYQVDE